MDQNHCFEGDHDQIEIQLVDRNHKCVRKLLLRDHHLNQVSKSQLTRSFLAHFAVVIHPVFDICLGLI